MSGPVGKPRFHPESFVLLHGEPRKVPPLVGPVGRVRSQRSALRETRVEPRAVHAFVFEFGKLPPHLVSGQMSAFPPPTVDGTVARRRVAEVSQQFGPIT